MGHINGQPGMLSCSRYLKQDWTSCCVRENIWFFLDTYWTSHAPASAQKISMGWVIRLPSSVGPYYSKKSCCVRLVSLLSVWRTMEQFWCYWVSSWKLLARSGVQFFWFLAPLGDNPFSSCAHLSSKSPFTRTEIDFLGLLAAYWLAYSKLQRTVFLWKFWVCPKLEILPPVEF